MNPTQILLDPKEGVGSALGSWQGGIRQELKLRHEMTSSDNIEDRCPLPVDAFGRLLQECSLSLPLRFGHHSPGGSFVGVCDGDGI